jgi:DNA polymerase-3 subunit epsilon
MRQIALDTETTGINTADGHRVIEIGCVEIENRRITGREYHCYLNPEREIDEGAARVHGLTLDKLRDKPLFNDIAEEFLDFIGNSELVIHNAKFDVGFLDSELSIINHDIKSIEKHALVLDTLALARQMHPGKKNSLDALCNRYMIDRSMRQVHGALIDADLLAKVYLAMTGGQDTFDLEEVSKNDPSTQKMESTRNHLTQILREASKDELQAHEKFLDKMSKDKTCLWRQES